MNLLSIKRTSFSKAHSLKLDMLKDQLGQQKAEHYALLKGLDLSDLSIPFVPTPIH